ncbi:hypothetical protein Hanom_Chr00s094482g01800561 [Helianthus anomalus]
MEVWSLCALECRSRGKRHANGLCLLCEYLGEMKTKSFERITSKTAEQMIRT